MFGICLRFPPCVVWGTWELQRRQIWTERPRSVFVVLPLLITDLWSAVLKHCRVWEDKMVWKSFVGNLDRFRNVLGGQWSLLYSENKHTYIVSTCQMYFSSLHSTVSCIFFTPSLLLMPSDTNVQAAFLNCISFVFVKCISQIHRTALSSPVPPEPNTQWHQCPLSLSLLFLLKHCFVSDLAAQVFTLSQFSATFPLP